MTKKSKKQLENIFTYKVKISEIFKPSRWENGEWVKNKEALGGYEFTGKEIRESIGFQINVLVYVNDELIGVCESVPNGFQTERKIFNTENEALTYFEDYQKQYKKLIIGSTFKPFVSSYKEGAVIE